MTRRNTSAATVQEPDKTSTPPSAPPVDAEIIFAEDGKPFASQQAALKYRTDKGLDKSQWHLKQCTGGFILIALAALAASAKPGAPQEGAIPTGEIDPEKFYWVRFSPRRDVNDTDDVMIDVNGARLSILREHTVPLPGPYVIAAKHARHPKYKKEAGKDRQILGWIERFPITVLGEATEADFRKWKKPAPPQEPA